MMVMMIPNDNDAGMSEPQLKTICESSQLHSLWGTIIRSLFEAHPGKMPRFYLSWRGTNLSQTAELLRFASNLEIYYLHPFTLQTESIFYTNLSLHPMVSSLTPP